jgi:hypothetical protein
MKWIGKLGADDYARSLSREREAVRTDSSETVTFVCAVKRHLCLCGFLAATRFSRVFEIIGGK